MNNIHKTNYELKPKLCKQCGDPICYKKRRNKFCSRKCSASFNNVLRKHTEETKQKISKAVTKYNTENPRNYGIQSDKWTTKICPICLSLFKTYITKPSKFCSRKCFLHDQKTGYNFINKENLGGYRQGSGRAKGGWYKGIWCDSSYELAYLMYHLDNNIYIKRNKESFPYNHNGKKKLYYPDFFTGLVYIEIKGFMTPKDKSKLSQFPKDKLIQLITGNDIKFYIDYAKQRYGNDFIELYENNPHNKKLNSCKNCGEPSKKIYCSRSCAGKHAGSKNLPKYIPTRDRTEIV